MTELPQEGPKPQKCFFLFSPCCVGKVNCFQPPPGDATCYFFSFSTCAWLKSTDTEAESCTCSWDR